MTKKTLKIFFLALLLIVSTLFICNSLFNGLSLKFRSTVNQDIQIFEGVDYRDYTEDYSWRFIVREGVNNYQIPLKGIRIQKFRIDLSSGNSIFLEGVTSKNFFGISACSLDPEYTYDVIVDKQDVKLGIHSLPDAKDPYVSIRCKNTFQTYVILKNFALGIMVLVSQLLMFLALVRVYRKIQNFNIYPWTSRLIRLGSSRPLTFIFCTVIFSVIISHNQVIFFGKSNIAPLGTSLIYSGTPSLPNYSFERIYDYHGTDTGAMMWQHIPYTYLAGDAINLYGEIPLWNRFNGGGRSLIGQGQAMIADPINLIIAVTGFSALKFDLKYILLKIFFSASLALSVYLLSGKVWPSCFIGFASSFISFYLFRLNHGAYFTMAYSPSILLAYFYALRGEHKYRCAIFSVFLFLGNWLVLNSGTGKEAYLAIIFYNLIGLSLLVAYKSGLSKFIAGALTLVLFALASSPIWYTFISYVLSEKSGYSSPQADQYPWSYFIFFAENLGFLATGGYQPAINFPIFFLYIASIIFTLTSKIFRTKLNVILSFSSMVLLFCAYGIVPKYVFLNTPFISSVHHITDVFSSIAIVPVIILAGLSLSFILSNIQNYKKTKIYLYIGIALLFALPLFEHQYQLNSNSILFLFYGILCIYLLHLLIELIDKFKNGSFNVSGALLFATVLFFLFFRVMQWPGTSLAIKDYVFVPSPRANLKPEIELINYWENLNKINPMRAIGTDGTLFSGYRSIYGIESIDGPDALFPRYYRELTEALNMPYGWYWRMEFNNDRVLKHLPALRFLNVGYVFSENKLSGLGKAIKSDAGINLYSIVGAWPRAFFIECGLRYEAGNILAEINNRIEGSDPFLILESMDQASKADNKSCKKPLIKPASNYILTSNTTKFDVIAPSSGYIYLGENYENGNFQASINGEKVKIERGNYAFKAIKVNSPGLYHVEVTYLPNKFEGLMKLAKISLIVYAFFFLFLLAPFFHNRQKN